MCNSYLVLLQNTYMLSTYMLYKYTLFGYIMELLSYIILKYIAQGERSKYSYRVMLDPSYGILFVIKLIQWNLPSLSQITT